MEKIEALRDQAARSSAQAKARINEPIEEMQQNNQRRSAKFEQAWNATKEALNRDGRPDRMPPIRAVMDPHLLRH